MVLQNASELFHRTSFIGLLHVRNSRKYSHYLILIDNFEDELNVGKHDVRRAGSDYVYRVTLLPTRFYLATRKLSPEAIAFNEAGGAA